MAGSIRKRGKGWELRIELGRDPATGKRQFQYRSVQGSKREAEEALTDALHRRDSGTDVTPSKILVSEYLDRWLRDYAETNVAPSTLLRYQQIVARLKPLIGRHRLQALRPAHVQECYAKLAAEGLAPRTVLHHHRMLRTALKQAMRWQLTPANAADATTPPRAQRVEMQVLTPEEVRQILEACVDDQLRTIVATAVHTGMRLGELLGLRWSDVDLTSGSAYIVRAAQYLPGAGVTYRAPKTNRSRRTVALSAETIRVLREHRARQAERRLGLGKGYEGDLVFAGIAGGPLVAHNVSRAFKDLVERVGVTPVRFHDLRHTAATLMLKAGVHPKVVSERLGHSTIAITLDTYSHVLPEMQRDAAQALDTVLIGTANRA